VVVVPLIIPIANQFGIDPYHLGIVFLLNLEIGYLTPPVGLNLFIASFRFQKSIATLYRAVLPYIGILLAALMVTTYVPALSTSMAELYGPQDLTVPGDTPEGSEPPSGSDEGDDVAAGEGDDEELSLDDLEGEEEMDLDDLEEDEPGLEDLEEEVDESTDDDPSLVGVEPEAEEPEEPEEEGDQDQQVDESAEDTPSP
jgi:hypothetical protein